MVGEAEQERGPRDARAGHADDDRHDARESCEHPGEPTPGVQGRDPFGDIGAGGVDDDDERQAEIARDVGRALGDGTRSAVDRTVVGAALDLHEHDASALELVDERAHRIAVAPGDGGGGEDHRPVT